MSDLQCPARLHLAPAMPGADVVARLRPVTVLDAADVDLDELADLHRGETVLVVGAHPYGEGPVVLEADSGGRRVTAWDLGHGANSRG